jgi:hypothetical protein
VIFIITRRDDVHADLVIGELRSLGVPYFRLNTDRAHEYLTSLSPDGFQILNPKNGKRTCEADIRSVWLRRRSFPEIDGLSDTFREFTRSEWLHFYKSIWFVLRDKFWVNSPDSNDRAAIKWLQLAAAKASGFNVPASLYTNNPTAVVEAEFLTDTCIYKAHDVGSLATSSEYAIHTSAFERQNVVSSSPECDFTLCPGIIQPLIEKAFELRVTVVGEHIFATKIDSQASEISSIDWRRADPLTLEHSPFPLSEADKGRCLHLLKQLNLNFAALDFIVTPSGELIFLELNANGQWGWIQELTHQPIAKSLAYLLAKNQL